MDEDDRIKERRDLLGERFKRQRDEHDYTIANGLPEKCDYCGAPINSHGHCPRCDY